MKEKFTLLFSTLCLVIATNAQTLTFSHDGVEIESGSTYYSGDLLAEDLEWGEYSFYPKIYLTSDQDTRVVVQVTSLDQRSIAVCTFGLCLNTSSSNSYTVTKDDESCVLTANVPEDLDIEYYAKTNWDDSQTAPIQITAWPYGNESAAVTMKLILTTNTELLSVGSTTTDKTAKVTVSGNILNYAFAKAGTRTLSIYGLDGSRVLSTSLTSADGQISLNGLARGLWLYSIEGAGDKLSGKIVVNK